MSFQPVSGSDFYGSKRIPLGGFPVGGVPADAEKKTPADEARNAQEQQAA